jgi:hypothetical protein
MPPEDPAAWDDDEWLAWLAEIDSEAPPEAERPAWRRHKSVPVAMLGAAMLGMQRAIYGDQDPEIVMIIEADGDAEDPERLEVHLDPDDPDASTVTVRPWLEESDEA